MSHDTKSQSAKNVPPEKSASSDLAVDEFFTQLQSEMRRPDLSQEAIAAAFQAIQKMALDSGTEEAAQAAVGQVARESAGGSHVCQACSTRNPEGARFCTACGVPLHLPAGEAHRAAPSGSAPSTAGEHHYHHHYHHHYFPPANGAPENFVADSRPSGSAAPREALRVHAPSGSSGSPSLSRAEAAVRRMTQDWAQACNTKQLDDLVDFYATDALLLRANLPPVRGTAAIREYFFSALDSGLGDAEFEPLRVELFGDIAFEAGRCKTLVPVSVGKRREERGKYLIIFCRQAAGDWKAMVDCWSSDLNLGVSAESGTQASSHAMPRASRKA